MAPVVYLADTSVFARLGKPSVVAALAPLAAAGQIAICRPVGFELGYSARDRGDYRALMDRLLAFSAVPTADADHRRALEVQGELVALGHHRALSLVDGLVAAIAEARGLTVLHYDADFELVAGVTGQAQQWVVERGSAD